MDRRVRGEAKGGGEEGAERRRRREEEVFKWNKRAGDRMGSEF